MQPGGDASATEQLLMRQLLYTSCAYSRIHVCIQGNPAFLQGLTGVMHSVVHRASMLGVSLNLLTSSSAACTKVS